MTEHTATEPAQHGEDPRQTQIYMRSDRVEPGDSPGQAQVIDKGTTRAEPVPARTATTPRRSTRIKTGPSKPPTARDMRAKTRTINKQVIGSKRNNAKNASRKRIASLVNTQRKIDEATPPPPKTGEDAARRHPDTVRAPIFTYHVPCPKSKRAPAPITQEEPEIEPAAAAATRRTSWKLDEKMRGKTNINPPLAGISRGALNQFMGNAFLEELKNTTINATPTAIEEVANGVVHPVTKETITKYKKLIEDPLLRDTWAKAMCKELGRLCQGFGETEGTDTMRFLDLEGIKSIPKDRVVTYARIVVDYRPQKADPNRVRITAGGNLIQYPGELTTRTSDLRTTKIMLNSVISTRGARYMTADAANFYLATPMERKEYLRIAVELIPQEFMESYNLQDKVKNGYVYYEIVRGMYGLPQAGILANKLLKERLAVHDYYEVAHTPGLFTHKARPI